MPQRKKTSNNEGGKNVKKSYIPFQNYTEELRLQTLTTTVDVHHAGRSIQLIKPAYTNPQSRKGRCVSSKPSVNSEIKFKQIMKQIKSMKIMFNKEKSPLVNKSKPKSKKSTNKTTQTQIVTDANSEVDLTCQLQNTLKKLDQTFYFKDDEDSLIPILSKTENSERQNQYLIITENDENINLKEIRAYCYGSEVGLKKSINQFRVDIYDTMARKIQRAWRRYKTGKIINQYAIVKFSHQISIDESSQSLASSSKGEKIDMIKREEMERWTEIVNLIKTNNSGNPDDMKKLLKNIQKKSKDNRKKLQGNEGALSDSSPVQIDESIESISSKPDHNSNKYRNYLDCDIFPSQQPKFISKNKQQQLLKKLSLPSNLIFRQQFNHSALSLRSLKSLSSSENQKRMQARSPIVSTDVFFRQLGRSKQRQEILKSTSEKQLPKYFHFTEEEIQNGQQRQEESNEKKKENKEDELNLLEESEEEKEDCPEFRRSLYVDPVNVSFNERIYNVEEVNKKLKEIQNKIYKEDEKEEEKEEEPEVFVFKSYDGRQIKINISEPYGDGQSDDDFGINLAEKAEDISNLIFNSLMIEVLKDFTKNQQTMCIKLKEVKDDSKKKRFPQTKKFGFKTNQQQIKKMIQGLSDFIMQENSQIYKHLEHPSGPSPMQMLKYMHQSFEEELLEDLEDDPNIMIMPNIIFDEFWALKAPSLVYEKRGIPDEKEEQRMQYLKSLNKIFYRCLFDCYNECLDFERNFGPFGKPFPWKKSATFTHSISQQKGKNAFQNAKKRLIEISCTYCGILIEKQEMSSLCKNQEYIEQVKQDRLSRMLASDLIEEENRWVFYDDEETEFLVEIGGRILEDLLNEGVLQLRGME